ncbi:MAG: hypothetical protein KatS3mg003_2115 [Candidatus Nitrosocaldaceae archaeon]|nr:MAG: hypothetical protein KatS3mg003_2044 [Candidatus Nitrosocaldaceae archaeon]GIU72636.1 MAG: hypothetical protein KatS3mg003_2115 [Candidatus Nitrosocaldaceae archaeon]
MAEASVAHIGAMIVIFAICVGIWFAVRASRPKSEEAKAST